MESEAMSYEKNHFLILADLLDLYGIYCLLKRTAGQSEGTEPKGRNAEPGERNGAYVKREKNYIYWQLIHILGQNSVAKLCADPSGKTERSGLFLSVM